jgi:uncharacterized cupredoxin-like copper-binding protein
MTSKLSCLALLIAVILTGCSSDSGSSSTRPSMDAAAIVDSANWSNAETQNIVLSDYSFTPNNPVFRRDQAYRLHLENKSTHTHTFGSDTFFQAIAVQDVQVGGANVSPEGLKNIELEAGQAADISFVAVNPGTYEFYCDVFLHDTMGMDGKIVIQ